jgi:hypothetical protein
MDNEIVFDDKTFQDLLRDIYSTTVSKREQINAMIAKLLQLVHTPEEASIIFPIIQDFLDTSIKNDGHVVQIAQISQKLQSVSKKLEGEGGLLSEFEKNNLLRLIQDEIMVVDDSAKKLKVKDADIPDTPPKKLK